MSPINKDSTNPLEEKKLNSSLSRRDMIKVSGLLALGLAYSKPFVETVKADSIDGFDADAYNASGEG